MFQEKRPTCVTVIGWAWIIIGGMMCFCGVMVVVAFIVGYYVTETPAEPPQSIPLEFKLFAAAIPVQLAFGTLGLVSGVNLLKLKSWPRGVLEVLTWLLIVGIIGWTGFLAFETLSGASWREYPVDSFGGFALTLVVGGVYVIPLCVMLRNLRGTKVRDALGGNDVGEDSLNQGE